MSQLRQIQSQLASHQVAVLVVTFEAAAVAAAHAAYFQYPWPLLLDPDRQLYQAYGMQRGGVAQVMGPGLWGTYLRLLAQGRRLRRPTGDVYQLGGDVLIDGTGIVRQLYVSETPIDRPTMESIVAWVETLSYASDSRQP